MHAAGEESGRPNPGPSERHERSPGQDIARIAPHDLYEQIVNTCPSAIAIHRDGVIIFANAAAARLLGASAPDELVGLDIERLSHPDFLDAALERARRVQDEGTEARALEEKLLRLDGRVIDARLSSVPYIIDGKPAVLTVAEDVTARRRAEDLEMLIAAAMKASREAILLFRLEDRVLVEANWTWYELTGTTPASMQHQRVDALPCLVNPGELEPLIEAVRLGRRARDAWLSIRRPDGDIRSVLVTTERVMIADRPHVLAYGRDMTQQLSLERQQRHLQKMDALGRLAGGIAHDFNNLLTVISSYAQLAAESPADADTVREALREIHRATVSASELTQALLSFSRGTRAARTRLDVDDVIADLRRILERILGPAIALIHDASETPALVSANRGELEQVIVNLVVNGRDAMPGGGTVTIRVRTQALDSDSVMFRNGFLVRRGQYVVLEVKDTGHGIPADARDHVFEPFFTTKAPGEGTGLGLSTAYGIVKQHGGYIWFETALRSGTTFFVALPKIDG